jgi:hypothetical protein
VSESPRERQRQPFLFAGGIGPGEDDEAMTRSSLRSTVLPAAGLAAAVAVVVALIFWLF